MKRRDVVRHVLFGIVLLGALLMVLPILGVATGTLGEPLAEYLVVTGAVIAGATVLAIHTFHIL